MPAIQSPTRRRIRAAMLTPVLAVLALVGSGATAPALAQPGVETWSVDLSRVDGDDTNVAVSRDALVLDDTKARQASIRSAVAQGMLTVPPRVLAAPVGRVAATVDAELPPGSRVLVDLRALRPDGTWTQWTEVRPGAPALLGEPRSVLQVRVVLIAGHAGGSPRVHGIEVIADPGPPLPPDAIRDIRQPLPVTYPIFATREGLVGGTTANGHTIKERDHFVALPSRRGLSPRGSNDYSVKVCANNGRCAWAPVWDVGPWNITDDYWNPPDKRQSWKDLPQGRPEADAAYRDNYNGGKDGFGRTVRNPAGIDLADGTFWDALQLKDNSWVDVTYLWTGHGLAGTVRTHGEPLEVRGGLERAVTEIGLAGNGSRVLVECEVRGEAVEGTQGHSDVWLRIGPNQFLPKAWVEAPPAPPC